MAEPDVGQALGTGEGLAAATTCVVTLDTAQTSGRTVYAAFGNATTGRTLDSVADSQSGTWVKIRSSQHLTGAEVNLWARTAGATLGIGDTVTATFNGTTASVGVVMDVIGSSTTESAGGAHGSSGTTPSITVTRTLTNSVMIAAVVENAALIDGDLTQDADYTLVDVMPSNEVGVNLRLTVAWRDHTASGNDTYSVTLSASRSFAAVASDFGVASTPSKDGLIPMTGAGG